MLLSQADCRDALRVGWGIPVAVIAPARSAQDIGQRIARQGGVVLRGGAKGIGLAQLVVIDGDGCGDNRLRRLIARLGAQAPGLPVIILSRGCAEQVFPPRHQRAPLRLRAPLSPVALRLAFEYLFGNENGAPRIAERPVFG